MAVMAGKDGVISIDTDAMGYIDTWTLTMNRGTYEASSIGKDFKEFGATVKDFSVSASGTLDYADTAQKKLADSLITGGAGTPVSLKLKAGATLTYTVSAVLTSISVGASHGDKVTVSYNFQGTGDISTAA